MTVGPLLLLLPFLLFSSTGLFALEDRSQPELAPPAAAGAEFPEVPTIPVEEIHAGMRGYGLSVFVGTQPERFEVEVLGVLANPKPDGSYILARLSGQNLDESGVIAGMSGSPVYFDGRLAGAVAFSWPFATEPIAGITPIAAMRARKASLTSGRGKRVTAARKATMRACSAASRGSAARDMKVIDTEVDYMIDDTAGRDDFGDGLWTSASCLEEAPFNDLKLARAAYAAYPMLRSLAAAPDVSDTCDLWVKRPADPKDGKAVESDIPSLILSGAYDPVTPPQYARLAASTLHRSFYFEFPGVGHDVLGNEPCADDLAGEFLDDPDLMPTHPCLGQLTTPDFAAPGR